MNIFFSIFFFAWILISVILRNHKSLVFVLTLSVFTDIFSISAGPMVINLNILIGFVSIPFWVGDKNFFKKSLIISEIKRIYRPLFWYILLLILVGIIFGFIFPWQDSAGYRTWSQKSAGRSIVTIVRIMAEVAASLYLLWAVAVGKVNLKFIVNSVFLIVFTSLIVAIIEFIFGYPLINGLIQISPRVLEGRFTGLCGEPKNFGRSAALAYFLFFSYYLNLDRSKYYIIFIGLAAFSVFLSMSASTFILFGLFNLFIIVSKKKISLLFLFIPLVLLIFNSLDDSIYFESTKNKIDHAIWGSEILMDYGNSNSYIMLIASRFDIFDHLAILFLYEHPEYIFTGTGPNLISIPASDYVSSFPIYSSYAATGGIDSVPNVLITNILSSVGLFGLFSFYLFLKRCYNLTVLDFSKFSTLLFYGIVLYAMIIYSFSLYYFIALIIGVVLNKYKIQVENFNSPANPS